MNDTRTDASESLRLLLWASAATLALWYVPFAGVVVVPVRYLVTYVHEICHALGALLTLGWPVQIEISLDGSGLTRWLGGVRLIAQAAGYVGTPLVGAGLLLLATRRALVRPALVGLGAVFALVAVWLGGNLLAWIVGLGFGALLIAGGVFLSPRAGRFALSFLAVQCVLNALTDLSSLFSLSVSSSGIETDAFLMAEASGGIVPAIVWTAAWSALAVVVLALALRSYYNLTVRRAASPAIDGNPFARLERM